MSSSPSPHLLFISDEKASLKEPSRLESMCALSGVDSAAKKLTESSGLGVVRAYGAKAGVAS
jgi:translation initiation factor 3 subunit H